MDTPAFLGLVLWSVGIFLIGFAIGGYLYGHKEKDAEVCEGGGRADSTVIGGGSGGSANRQDGKGIVMEWRQL